MREADIETDASLQAAITLTFELPIAAYFYVDSAAFEQMVADRLIPKIKRAVKEAVEDKGWPGVVLFVQQPSLIEEEN